jgi:hypothetical protein
VRLSKRMAVVSLLSFGIAAVGLTFAVMDRAKKAR